VGRKRDIRDVEKIARQFGMDPETRREFGDFLEECKRKGDPGTRNERGDFTWNELKEKAKEFLAHTD
jgi:phage terminase small subunit